jgi:DNA-binding SARP family transcriptional activator
MLAFNANRVTSVDQLIDAVWETTPPGTARAQIQICISAVRKLLEDNGSPARISTRSPGYVLVVEKDHLDSSRFSALVDAARQHERDGELAEALAKIRTALGLWRGPALADVPSSAVQRSVAGLSERYVTAEIARARIELALGRHAEVIPDLRALAHDHPLREELYGHLMLALYRSGRQTEALETYRRARVVLIEEAGIEPANELRDLERAILNREDGLLLSARQSTSPSGFLSAGFSGGPVMTPRQLPSGIGDLAGHGRILSDIVGVLSSESRWRHGLLRLAAISGRGGVGKSCLAIQAAHQLAESFPDGQLYADMTEREIGQPGRVLGRFLRALGVRASAIPDDLGERAEMYRSMLASQRVIVVLDGVTSEEDVLPLLPGTPTCAVIATSRRRLSGLEGTNFVHLTEFDQERSKDFLIRLIGRERVVSEQEAADELVHRCEGLPLALRVVGARLNAKPHWTLATFVEKLADEARMLDELSHGSIQLRSSIALTYCSLTDDGQRLFRLLALIEAGEFASWAAAALLDVDLKSAEQVVEELVDTHVLGVTDRSPGRSSGYRFHDLVRAYAREKIACTETPDSRDAAFDRWLGAWLGRVTQMHRTEYGGDYTIVHGSASRWLPPEGFGAGLGDSGIVALDRERGPLVRAIRQAAAAGRDELCWDLMLSSVTLFETKGYFDDWRESAMVARAAAERAGNHRGRAAAHYALGALQLSRKHPAEAVTEFAVALDLFSRENDAHGRALVLRNLAFLDRLRGDTNAMLAKYNEALSILRAVGDRLGEAHVLCNVAKYWLAEGDETHGRQLIEEALAISVGSGARRGEAQALCALADLHICARSCEEADVVLSRALRIVQDLGDLTGEAHVMYGISVVRQMDGRTELAELALRQALASARSVGERQIEAQALARLGELFLTYNDISAAQVCCGEALELCEELKVAVWTARTLVLSAEINATTGAVDQARVDAERAVAVLAGHASRDAENVRSQARRRLAALRVDNAVGGNALSG